MQATKHCLMTLLMLFTLCQQTYAAQTIRFAMEATYPPFTYINEAGAIQGFDVDIATALCHALDATCQFSNQPWTSLIPSLKLGKFDALISAISITAQREKQVAFTKPYYHNTASYVTSNKTNIEITADSLKKSTLGVQAGSTLESYIHQTYGRNIPVKTYNSIAEAFLDLKADRINIVLADTPVAQAWVKLSENSAFHMLPTLITDSHFFGDGFGIAVQKNNQQLLKQLNSAIDIIQKNGEYEKIYQRYFD
jgi:arginine transport system substrate-binding protein